MIAILCTDGSIGNDGTTRQTPEVCLTRTKSFFVCLNEYIQVIVYQISKNITFLLYDPPAAISSRGTRAEFR